MLLKSNLVKQELLSVLIESAQAKVELLWSVGGSWQGRGRGEFSHACGPAIDQGRGVVCVADDMNNRVKLLKLSSGEPMVYTSRTSRSVDPPPAEADVEADAPAALSTREDDGCESVVAVTDETRSMV